MSNTGNMAFVTSGLESIKDAIEKYKKARTELPYQNVWGAFRNMFGRENMISEGSTISENDTICINIKYHKIGEVFNYKVGMSEMTLRVDKCDRCSGCAFENYIYDCVKSGCLGCEREDGESVRYTIVNT